MSIQQIPTIDVHEASVRAGDGELLVDVREIDEWLAGHIDGATHVPLMSVPEVLDTLPKDRPIVCVCRSGNRSGQATVFLIANGFDAVNMAGGMKAWAMAGLPVQRTNGDPGIVI